MESNARGVTDNDLLDGLPPDWTAVVGDDVTHGILEFDSDGSFRYTPAVGFSGTDSFTYSLADADSAPFDNPATVTLTVVPPTCEVTLVDDAYTVARGESLHVDAPGAAINDLLCTGVALVVDDAATHGTLTLLPDGELTYVPDAGFVGIDSFTYTVGQAIRGAFGMARTAAVPPDLTATVTIDVTADPLPTAPSTAAPVEATTPTTVTPSPTGVPVGRLPATGADDKLGIIALATALVLGGGLAATVGRRRRAGS